MILVLIIVGAILGGALFNEFEFALLGGFLGFLLALVSKLSAKIDLLSQKIIKLEDRLAIRQKDPLKNQPAVARATDNKTSEKSDLELLAERAAHRPLATDKPVFKQSEQPTDKISIVQPKPVEQRPLENSSSASQTDNHNYAQTESADPWATQSKEPDLLTQLISKVVGYFTQGNIVVRVGAVILFFGISFLLKYAAEHSVISIQLRLTGVVVGAIILLAFGWKLKDKKQGYGLILQGAAVGILYLTLFASFRLYGLLPAGLAFPLLIIFCGLAMMLAVLQDSRALALLSIAGGFLAPVLISTGSGNHVALFSYYAVLNIAIFSVAWFKSWRLLNLTGFVFTFLIGTAWGITKYQAADFITTEPFLILFFILYTAIALLFASKHQANIKGYVDGTLIFGLPVIAFSLQVAMVADYQHGLAWSAFSLGAFYLISAYLIIKRGNKNLSLIAEAFIALGVIFTSLVIPFALDGEWTAASWAIEGAGLVWLGLRQSRWFAKYFGSLIQLVGGIIFLAELNYNPAEIFRFNAQLFGIVFVALGAIFSSYQVWLKKGELKAFEATSRFVFLIWGLLWWYLGGLFELSQLPMSIAVVQYLILFFCVSAIIWHLLESHLKWTMMTNLIWITLPLLMLSAVGYLAQQPHLFAKTGIIIWPVALIVFYALLFRQDKQNLIQRVASTQLHFTSLLFLFGISLSELNWLLKYFEIANTSWAVSLLALLGCGWLVLISQIKTWPTVIYPKAYQSLGLSVLMGSLVLWSFIANFSHDGNANPLPYIPLINPLDIVQGLVLLLLYKATHLQQTAGVEYSQRLIKRFFLGFIFIWLNIILLRSLHAWANITYSPHALFQSSIVQTSISIFWTLLGLAGTIWATRTNSRKLWISASSLMALVVVKLFLIDLDNSSSIERIISFVVVGLLLLVVGYFSPLPPKPEADTIEAETETQQEQR